ncbi:hypothetical protein THAOC_28542, partial [Thalassiosira oceanica]
GQLFTPPSWRSLQDYQALDLLALPPDRAANLASSRHGGNLWQTEIARPARGARTAQTNFACHIRVNGRMGRIHGGNAVNQTRRDGNGPTKMASWAGVKQRSRPTSNKHSYKRKRNSECHDVEPWPRSTAKC